MHLWSQNLVRPLLKMNMRQIHISFNSAKTWRVIVCWFLCFAPNLPELNPKLFCSDVQNKFRFSSGKFGAKHRNQQNHQRQVLAGLNEIWSCLIFIKLYKQHSFTKSIIFRIKCHFKKSDEFTIFIDTSWKNPYKRFAKVIIPPCVHRLGGTIFSVSGYISKSHDSPRRQTIPAFIQNLPWKLGQKTPSVGILLAYLDTTA